MKPLSCWVGRHLWTTRVEQGESYTVCSNCGKNKTPPKTDIKGPGYVSGHGGGPGDTGAGGADVGG